MGVKDGVKGYSYLRHAADKGLDTLKKIRTSLEPKFPRGSGRDPIVGIDTSIFIVTALRKAEAIDDFFMVPRVPVASRLTHLG